MKNVLRMLFAVFILSACHKPKACITTNKSNAAVNEEITFTNCSENTNFADWDFGDGTTLMGDAVTHKYAAPGIYTVKITAHYYEDRKKPNSKTITVTIN